MGTPRLQGKVAFITGAARGQGRAHAIPLAEEGADMIAVDICETFDSMNYALATEDDLQQAVKAVEARGRRIVARKGDVRFRQQLEDVLAEGIAQFGRLDAVVVNASVTAGTAPGPRRPSSTAWRSTSSSCCSRSRHPCPTWSAGARSSSRLDRRHHEGPHRRVPHSWRLRHAWAKRALASYTEVLALQLAEHMIRVNTVRPTNCYTPLLHNDDIYQAFRPDLSNPTREKAELPFSAM